MIHIGDVGLDTGADVSSVLRVFRKSSRSFAVGLWPRAGPTSFAVHNGVVPKVGVSPPANMVNSSLTRSILVGFDEEYSETTMTRSAESTSSTR